MECGLNARRNVLLALEDPSRIRTLDLGFRAPDFRSTLLQQDLLKPAPALEVLRLHCDTSQVILSPSIFACETPRLRELELRGCAIPRDSHLFRNLTYLSVDELPVDSTFTLFHLGTYSVWFTCLKLFSLALEGSIEVCADTLNHLVFPPTPCLEITCCNTEAGLDMAFFPTLMETLANLLKNIPPAQKLRALGISWQSEALKFRASTDENGDVSQPPKAQSFISPLCRSRSH
ncbi:hypothetical protein B0H14DRAFT_3486140 [Mycena olivaceomarginata]|nr:hypothetical protein B0H14DRAFT_3486140 [Mycena olivaceomarginata]